VAGIRKHGTHGIHLNIALLAAGSATDGNSVDTFVYQAFAGSSATASGGGGLSGEQEFVVEAQIVTAAVLTGQATNFASPRLTHRNAAGTIQNQVKVDFSAAGVVTVAFAPVNYSVASAAVATGAGTGTLTVVTGTALPWALTNGDTVSFDRLSNNATGLATPAMSALLQIGIKGA
jgi:hypothetical protein